MNKIPRIMIAGTNIGVGKTTVTLGVMSALVVTQGIEKDVVYSSLNKNNVGINNDKC